MGFNLNHLSPRVAFFLVAYTLNLSTVFAAVNVTVHDNDYSILYSPPGAWVQSVPNTLDFSGAHMLTQNPNATASFNFTGIAIYFLSPLWPYTVNTAVSLDSGPITLIDLVDHSRPSTGQGPETIQSHVVWNVTGLVNTEHNLRISVGAGQPFAIVDGLIYTIPTNVSSSLSFSPSSSLSPTSTLHDPIAASSTADVAPSKSKSVIAIALGSLFGVLGLLVIVGGGWYLLRRRKRPISEVWTVDSTPYTTSTSRNISMSAAGPNEMIKNEDWSAEQLYNNGNSMTQDGKSWYNPRYNNVGTPAPPIPSQSYYYGGYQNGISSHNATDRMPNRYVPGYALSTITERSTPQTVEGRTPLPNTPASYQSDLEYYTTQGSEASYRVSRLQQQQQPPSPLGGVQRTPSPTTQGYTSQRRKPVKHKPGGNWI